MTRLCFTLMLPLLAAAGCRPPVTEVPPSMEEIAESYVRLVLALGEHDADYVDAYFGPEEWREQARTEQASLDAIRERAEATLERFENVAAPEAGSPVEARRSSLKRELEALIARADLVGGARMSFDEESQALYDAVAPTLGEEHFREVIDRLEEELPGEGPLVERYDAFRAGFRIPADKLDAVFAAAIDACRERTRGHIELPEEESFTVEYVTGKSWSGYNWYQGDYKSLIQVNTDLPVYIDRALDLACHEGYPGHHVYNLLLERELVRERGWTEYAVYPLFSPRSLIAEGSANYGIEVAFPAAERIEFERGTLFPQAGLDAGRADAYYRVQELVKKLGYAGNEAARRYLDGEIDAEEAANWLSRYALMPRERARQRVRFIDQYRSYVINYNLGQDLVRRYIESRVGADGDPERRWQEFARLLSEPRLPSEM